MPRIIDGSAAASERITGEAPDACGTVYCHRARTRLPWGADFLRTRCLAGCTYFAGTINGGGADGGVECVYVPSERAPGTEPLTDEERNGPRTWPDAALLSEIAGAIASESDE